MIEKVANLEREALEALRRVKTRDEARALEIKYLGRKGLVAALLQEMASLDKAERSAIGQSVNRLKTLLADELSAMNDGFASAERDRLLKSSSVDATLPERALRKGALHPLTTVSLEIEEIFAGLGFDVAEGPQVESDHYNFEALNIPPSHPARDMQDTFYVDGDGAGEQRLLRTHTSPVQIRVMEKRKPPLRVIAPGAVFRRDSDVTHSPMFHQVEGFMVDENITFADLKGVLTIFLRRLFGGSTPVRLRPSFFPFTEPSAEVDIGCVICGAKSSSCRVCKGTGWLEILGSGMIHPEVFKSVGYDPTKVTGFAFGIGVERIAMLKYGIDDLRLFFENDLRFLGQF
jgi:phenylalanyl-tRNA synthetase alpha chain